MTLFGSVGSRSSTISLSILKNDAETIAEESYISRVDVVLGTLLAKCADNDGTFDTYQYIIIS
jgi:hypothetical protein